MKLKILVAFTAIACSSLYAQTIEVKEAWARAIVQGQKSTGAFMKITAKDGARLVSVASPLAGVAQVHEMKLDGSIGITLNLSPCIPMDANNPADVKAAVLQDALLNTLFLDPLFKGSYPAQAMDSIRKYDPSFQPGSADMRFIADNKPDFLGINFYAPAFV